MPGLMRGMARTAAVVGTATATRNAVNRRQADKNAQAYAQATNAANAQQAPPPQAYAQPAQEYYAPPVQAQQEDVITQLERLGALYAQGLLTDQEFAAQKAALLGL
jgi:hypothetical protein